MKIQVKNLGAINVGTIDLSKKLNVFCGPNGTGKTYMAYAIYGFLESQFYFGESHIDTIRLFSESKSTSYKIDFMLLNAYRANLLNSFKTEFDSLFGVSNDLAKLFFKETTVDFIESNEILNKKVLKNKINTVIQIDKIEVTVSKKEDSDIIELNADNKSIPIKDFEPYNFMLNSKLMSLLVTYPISSAFILPVERNSIYTFSKELSISKQEAVDHFHGLMSKKVEKIELFFKRSTRYPLPIKDGLMIADDLLEIKKKKSQFFDFATKIESELLHGKLDINQDGEIQFKSDKATTKKLPIHLTASIVKSLSSLVIYLKHIARHNDLIIIDEPEINLHPDNQIIITKLFAKLINKGFRLLVSTHSDYIIREINNLIMLSKINIVNNEAIKLLGYSNDEKINIEDIDVHYFHYHRKTAKQVEIEKIVISETGFEIPSVDDTIEKQNKSAEALFYELKYGGENE